MPRLLRRRRLPRLGDDELLARHQVQQVEHLLVEHLPGADLLLDHVGAGLFYVHDGGFMKNGDYNLALRRGPVSERVRESLRT